MVKIIIAGPCALESREQLAEAVELLKETHVRYIRASLWKPRTSPGWHGICASGLSILLEETIPHGFIPATEIMNSVNAKYCVDALKEYGPDAKMVFWIGSRNQNHFEIHDIARILSQAADQVTLMFKNQMWADERHWYGIYEHIISAGFPKEKLATIHRGFAPGHEENPDNLRNLPDYEMAMRMKEKMGIQMILDPSHIAGDKDKVLQIVEQSKSYDWDGYILEVHNNAANFKTDSKQHISMQQFKEMLEMISIESQL